MDRLTLLFPLRGSCYFVVEKGSASWQLRVIDRGTTIVTHPVANRLAERLLSARRLSLQDARAGRCED